MSEHWPIFLEEGELLLRPLRVRDRQRWLRVRAENKDWLAEWLCLIHI
jgi:ribosomal-protein-alanine N-acetyltransferase